MKQAFRMTALAMAALPTMGFGATPAQDCAAIDDAASRLACYDRAAGRGNTPPPARPSVPSPAASQPGPVVHSESPPPAPPAPVAATGRQPVPGRDQLRRRTDFDSRIVAVERLRRNYHRLRLEDGTVYDTAVQGLPPAVGTPVHVRRTPVGTTYFDLPDAKPIAVRMPRRL
ncbi:hypothetical protein [Sphingomonas sp.]|uniref:hypothetical protein n=1 Tax=Sphingomonas sp. TaxID=28214 RepID=UPI003B3A9180